jgi:hypothetical protein
VWSLDDGLELLKLTDLYALDYRVLSIALHPHLANDLLAVAIDFHCILRKKAVRLQRIFVYSLRKHSQQYLSLLCTRGAIDPNINII